MRVERWLGLKRPLGRERLPVAEVSGRERLALLESYCFTLTAFATAVDQRASGLRLWRLYFAAARL